MTAVSYFYILAIFLAFLVNYSQVRSTPSLIRDFNPEVKRDSLLTSIIIIIIIIYIYLK
jgi:hypothetical protein